MKLIKWAVVGKVITYLYTGEMVFEDLQLGLLLDLLDLLRLMNLSEDFKQIESWLVDRIKKRHFNYSVCFNNLHKCSENVWEALMAYLKEWCEERDKTRYRFEIFAEWLSTNTMDPDEKAKAAEMFDFEHFSIDDLASIVMQSGLYSRDKIFQRMQQLSYEIQESFKIHDI